MKKNLYRVLLVSMFLLCSNLISSNIVETSSFLSTNEFPIYPGFSEKNNFAIDSVNGIHLTYKSPTDLGIYYTTSNDGGNNWTTPLRIDQNGEKRKEPSIAIASDGSIHIAWAEKVNPTPQSYEIYHIYSQDNGVSFSSPTLISIQDTHWSRYPVIRCYGTNIHIAWVDDNKTSSSGEEVFYRRNTAGGIPADWNSIQSIYTSSNSTAVRNVIDLMVDVNGVHIVYAEETDEYIGYKLSVDYGVSWSGETKIIKDAEDGFNNCKYPRLTSDITTGKIWISWSGQSSTARHFMKVSSNGGATWSAVLYVPEVLNEAGYHDLEARNDSLFLTHDVGFHTIVWLRIFDYHSNKWSDNLLANFEGNSPISQMSDYGLAIMWQNLSGELTYLDIESCNQPTVPTLLLPTDVQIDVEQPIILSWGVSAGSIQYQYQIDDNSDFSSPLHDDIISQTSILIPQLNVLTDYYWRVKSGNDCLWSSFSPTWVFTTDNGGPPGSIDGIVMKIDNVTPIVGAAISALQDDEIKGTATTLSDGSYMIPNLTIGYYDIQASFDGYITQTQENNLVENLTTTTVDLLMPRDIPSPVITSISPIPSFKGDATIIWSEVTVGVGYEFELADNSSFTSVFDAQIFTPSPITEASYSCLSEGTWYARVRTDGGDGEFSAWSTIESFTVAYTLSMPFTVNQDGWNFSNTKDKVWPSSYWNASNTDSLQYNSSLYSDNNSWFSRTCVNNRITNSAFPSWPMYAYYIGYTGSYRVDPNTGLRSVFYPKMDAAFEWRDHLLANGRNWDGSCAGFSITSLFFFDGYYDENDEYGTTPLVTVSADDAFHDINRYQLVQFRHNVYRANKKRTTLPNETVEELRIMLNQSNHTKDKYLDLRDYTVSPKFAHAVVPYKMIYSGCGGDIVQIYVYDNAYSSPFEGIITVDLNTNSWSYEDWEGRSVGGNKGIFLSEEISKFNHYDIYKTFKANEANSDSGFVRIYVQENQDVKFTFPNGDSLGLVAGNLIYPTDTSLGYHIISASKSEAHISGYLLENSDFNTQISNSSDSTTWMSVYSDSSMISFKKTSSTPTALGEIDLTINDNSIFIKNNNVGEYSFEILSELSDSEVYYHISNININTADSISIMSLSPDSIQINNFSNHTNYSLDIMITDLLGQFDEFSFDSIDIGSNNSHLIDLSNINTIENNVIILIDTNLNGNFDDTLYSQNQNCCVLPIRGNVDGDVLDQIDISDLVFMVAYMFSSGDAPPCFEEADVDGSGGIDISDIVMLVAFMFSGGDQPAVCP